MAESRLASTQQSLSAVMASVWTSCEMPSAMQIDFLLKYVMMMMMMMLMMIVMLVCRLGVTGRRLLCRMCCTGAAQSQPSFASKMSTVLELWRKGAAAMLCCERIKSILRRAMAKSSATGGAGAATAATSAVAGTAGTVADACT